jgi:hypothetical protein
MLGRAEPQDDLSEHRARAHGGHEENEHERISAEAEKFPQWTYASDHFRLVGAIDLEPALRFRAGQAGLGGAQARQQLIEGLLMTAARLEPGSGVVRKGFTDFRGHLCERALHGLRKRRYRRRLWKPSGLYPIATARSLLSRNSNRLAATCANGTPGERRDSRVSYHPCVTPAIACFRGSHGLEASAPTRLSVVGKAGRVALRRNVLQTRRACGRPSDRRHAKFRATKATASRPPAQRLLPRQCSRKCRWSACARPFTTPTPFDHVRRGAPAHWTLVSWSPKLGWQMQECPPRARPRAAQSFATNNPSQPRRRPIGPGPRS